MTMDPGKQKKLTKKEIVKKFHIKIWSLDSLSGGLKAYPSRVMFLKKHCHEMFIKKTKMFFLFNFFYSNIQQPTYGSHFNELRSQLYYSCITHKEENIMKIGTWTRQQISQSSLCNGWEHYVPYRCL